MERPALVRASQVVAFDRPTGTLLVTDLVVSISATPPEILEVNDARALLYHARDEPSEAPVDTPEVRTKGWQKIALFASYFQVRSPQLEVPDSTVASAVARDASGLAAHPSLS